MANFFDHHNKNPIKSNKNIRKITIGKGDYTTSCLLDPYFKGNVLDDSNRFK